MGALYREFHTQAELDDAYDVERSVPDFGRYLDRFGEGNTRALAELQPQRGLRYGATRPEYLDFYAGPGERPLLVFFHGGYWRILSSEEFAFAVAGPVKAGFAVANVNYTLCPNAPMDELVRQCRAAIAWLVREERLSFDRRRIVVGGHSAGAHLAAMCLLTEWSERYDLPDTILRGGLLVSGLFDLRPLPFTFVQPSLQLDPVQVLRNSPHLLVRPGLPPIHVAYGDAEPPEFQRQSADFAAAWAGAGNLVTRESHPGHDHFSIALTLQDGDLPVIEALKRLA